MRLRMHKQKKRLRHMRLKQKKRLRKVRHKQGTRRWWMLPSFALCPGATEEKTVQEA